MARRTLSFVMFASRAFSSERRSRGFIAGSPPPAFAATVISLMRRVNTLPFFESAAALRCLMFAHLLCPAMPIILRERPARDVERRADRNVREAACPLQGAGDVPVAGRILDEQQGARREAVARAVVELNLADAGDDDDELALRRAMLVVQVLRRGVAKEQAQRGKVRRRGAAAPIRLHRHFAPLDAGTAVIGGEDPGYDHDLAEAEPFRVIRRI